MVMVCIEETRNYYEILVMDYLNGLEISLSHDSDFLTDVYCLALNQLPSFYVRYGVDMFHFITDEKRQEMEENVIKAISHAINVVSQNKRT